MYTRTHSNERNSETKKKGEDGDGKHRENMRANQKINQQSSFSDATGEPRETYHIRLLKGEKRTGSSSAEPKEYTKLWQCRLVREKKGKKKETDGINTAVLWRGLRVAAQTDGNNAW
jgi:hypothetical protein